jgi:glycine cleavage system H lipoate-binding protein
MTCPFLKEARVRYCQTASLRKLIPMAAGPVRDEKCGSGEHCSCGVFQAHAADQPGSGACPYLHESLMQYCGAAAVTRFIPYSESLLSRCGNDGFRYCQLYLGMAHPALEAEEVEGIAVPGWLRYSANHMWLDMTEDGTCHAGIDAFLSRALGRVERISYVWQKGNHRPTAVLTAGGIDFEVVFPNALLLTNCNLYLRADPDRLAAEPYTAGWLFEGTPLESTADGLMEGAAAREWMEQEQRRINEFLQREAGSGQFAADGGLFAAGLPRLVERDRMLALYHEFFSPWASGKR